MRKFIATLLMRPLTIRRGFALALAISFAINLLIFRDIWWHPNHYLFSAQNDGLKNYYTVYYHAAYDSAAVWFGGMNYPMGEHVVFTDNQPVVSAFFQFLVRSGHVDPAFIPGALNWLMMFSMVLSAGFLWLAFAQLGIANVFGMTAAALVSNLAPQYLRMEVGHYALAYACVIPAALALWLKIYRTTRANAWYWQLTLSMLVLFISLVHLYYGFILFLLLVTLSGASFLTEPSRRRQAVVTAVLAALPLLIVRLGIALTDPVRDRPDSPNGYLAYRAAWESIFLPLGHFPATLIGRFVLIRSVDQEGLAYVGVPATVACLFLVVAAARALTRRAGEPRVKLLSGLETTMLSAGLVNFLLAIGIPFVFGLEWLVPHLGPIQQFRSIGRFAWNFYYLINLLTFSWIFARWSAGRLRLRWVLAAFAVFAFHIYDYRADSYATLANVSPLSADGQAARLARTLDLSASGYQAIWPIPYFHVGSEKTKREPACVSATPTLQLSWLTGIPTNGVMMSRTSYSQTIAQIAIHEDTAALGRYVAALRNRKPFLVVRVKRDCPLTPSDSAVIGRSERIYAGLMHGGAADSLILYRLPVTAP